LYDEEGKGDSIDERLAKISYLTTYGRSDGHVQYEIVKENYFIPIIDSNLIRKRPECKFCKIQIDSVIKVIIKIR
jgi:hypothetical protein